MSKFRTRLMLDSLDDRLVPSAPTPATPQPEPALTAQFPPPQVDIDMSTVGNRVMQLRIRVDPESGAVPVYVTVIVDPQQTPGTKANMVRDQLQAAGVLCLVNGDVVTILGLPGDNVDTVKVDAVIPSNGNPYDPTLQPPSTTGLNGATGKTGFLPLPAPPETNT